MPETSVRELKLGRRHGAAYFPRNETFESGQKVAKPVRNEVFVAEADVDYDAIRDHLETVPHAMFGRFERTVFEYRTERRRLGLRVVIEDDDAMIMFKLAFG